MDGMGGGGEEEEKKLSRGGSDKEIKNQRTKKLVKKKKHTLHGQGSARPQLGPINATQPRQSDCDDKTASKQKKYLTSFKPQKKKKKKKKKNTTNLPDTPSVASSVFLCSVPDSC